MDQGWEFNCCNGVRHEDFASGSGRSQPCCNPVNASVYGRLNLVAAVGLEPTTYGL